MTYLSMGIPADIVAKQLLWLRRGIDTTPMHIIKLVYLAHGWLLGFEETPLIHEYVEAWKYGPVIPSLYHKYKIWGSEPIEGEVVDMSKRMDADQASLIEWVKGTYTELGGIQLSTLTHQPGTPWDITIQKDGEGAIIPDELIQKHFSDLSNKYFPDD